LARRPSRALFYGEGADVAVSRLYDKDVSQLEAPLQPTFIRLHKDDAAQAFVTGRQLLVVGAIVLIPLTVKS